MLKFYTAIFLSFIYLNIKAQNDSIPKFYKDSTGKLFIAPNAHVYLFIGTTPDGSRSSRLIGDNGNNPMHWSGHGLKHLTHLNVYLGRNVSFDLFSDNRPPKTLMGLDSKKSVQKEDTYYVSGQSFIEFSSVDQDAGLKGIYYSINDGTYLKYLVPIVLKSEGQYKISVYALDNVGNKEEITRTIVVDNTPPLSKLSFEGDKYENIISGRSSISISSTDTLGVKQIYYSIDTGKIAVYNKSIKASALSEGDHIIHYYSIDVVENIEETKSFSFFVDKTPPMIFEEVLGNTYMVNGKEFSSGRSQLKIAAVDNKSGVKEIQYSLNNNSYKVFERPIYLSDILGTLNLKSFATDNVGNKSYSDSQTESFTMPTIDIMGPQLSFNFIGSKKVQRDTVWIGLKTKVTISATDLGAGVNRITYKINGGGEKLYSEPFTLENKGIYNVVCTAYDNVDNSNLISFNFGVHTIPPVSTLDLAGDKYENIVSGRSNLVISSVDEFGVKQSFYSIDSNKIEVYNKPIKMLNLSDGEHKISWYSTDELDNVEAAKSFNFYVDKTPPMVFEEIVGNTYMVAGREFSSGRSQLRIAAVDNKSGVKEINYSLNNNPFKLYEKPVYLSDILGTVGVQSYAIDNVGNKSTSDTQSEAFTMPSVDITGPMIFYNFIGPKITLKDTVWIGPKTKISISTNDIGSGVNRVNYKFKGGEEKVYSEPFIVNEMGVHSLVCTAYDNVDNVNLISFSFAVDNKAPSIFYHYSIEPLKWLVENGEKIPIFSKTVKLYLAATDNLSGVDKLFYNLNSNGDIQYSSAIQGFKASTTHTLQIKTIDVLGNQSEQVVRFRIE